MHPVEHLRARVDESLANAHLHASRLEDDAWGFSRGASRGLLLLANHGERPEDAVVAVRVPLMRVPPGREAEFALALLEANVELGGIVAFGVENGVAQVVGARMVADSEDRALAGLAVLAAGAADAFRGRLLDEFGRDLAVQ